MSLFDEVRDVNRLPKEIAVLLGGGIANPADKFRESDVSDASLPLRRLVIAGVSERYVVLNYEKGGISDYFVTAVFSRSKDETKLLWASTFLSADV